MHRPQNMPVALSCVCILTIYWFSHPMLDYRRGYPISFLSGAIPKVGHVLWNFIWQSSTHTLTDNLIQFVTTSPQQTLNQYFFGNTSPQTNEKYTYHDTMLHTFGLKSAYLIPHSTRTNSWRGPVSNLRPRSTMHTIPFASFRLLAHFIS